MTKHSNLLDEALQVDRMLEERHPDDMQHRFDVMYDLLLLGQTHLESERPKEAQPLLNESHQKALKLHDREPLNIRWIEILAAIEYHQGEVFQALGQQDQGPNGLAGKSNIDCNHYSPNPN